MHIENKWKRYAVGHHLSDYSGDGAELFDALMAEEDDPSTPASIAERSDSSTNGKLSNNAVRVSSARSASLRVGFSGGRR